MRVCPNLTASSMKHNLQLQRVLVVPEAPAMATLTQIKRERVPKHPLLILPGLHVPSTLAAGCTVSHVNSHRQSHLPKCQAHLEPCDLSLPVHLAAPAPVISAATHLPIVAFTVICHLQQVPVVVPQDLPCTGDGALRQLLQLRHLAALLVCVPHFLFLAGCLSREVLNLTASDNTSAGVGLFYTGVAFCGNRDNPSP